VVAILAGKELQCMRQQIDDRLQALRCPLRGAGDIYDEGLSNRTRASTAEGSHRCLLEACGEHGVNEPGRLPFQDGQRRFGGDVSQSKAGATGGYHELRIIGGFSDDCGYPIGFVRNEMPSHIHAVILEQGLEHITRGIFTHTCADSITDGDDGRLQPFERHAASLR
jgi:hypothetical protein